MTKYHIALFLLLALFTRISYAVESNPFSSVAIIPGSHSTLTLHELGQKALKYLISCQNSDGSFGQDANQSIDTSLAVIALTRTHQFAPSRNSTLASAADWLRQSTPESTDEKQAVIMALSGLQILRGRNVQKEDSLKNADLRKLETLLKEVDEKNKGIWRDALAMTKLPDSVATPDWLTNDKATREKYRKQQDFPLDTLEDYLNGYLHAIVISWDNDRSMDALAMAVQNKQNHDGSMRTASASNSIGATALTILYPTVFQKTAHLYFSVPVKQTN